MYQINFGSDPLYIPGIQDSGYVVVSPEYTQELNKAGELTFSVYPGNVAYNKLNALTTPITLLRDGKEIFYGRVLSSEKNFNNLKQVTCEGALAFLNDVVIRPFDKTFNGKNCVKQYIQYILGLYNAGCGADWKRIYTGNVTVSDGNNYLYRYKEGYNSALDVLLDHTIETTLGGYLSTRRSGGKTYLDYTVEPGEKVEQRIEFGSNLLELTESVTAEDVFTVLLPIGADDKDGNPITIKSVNNNKDYIESATGISVFGRVWRTQKYDDITEPRNLLSAAKKDLAAGIAQAVSLDLDAVDLYNIDKDTDSFGCGNLVRVVSFPHGIDDWFVCSSAKLVLDDVERSNYTLGVTYRSLSERQSFTSKAVSGNKTLTETATVTATVANSKATQAVNTANAVAGEVQTKASTATVEGLAQQVQTLTGKQRVFNGTFEGATLTTGVVTSLGSVSLATGKYIISFSVRFASNTNGDRSIGISTNSSSLIGSADTWVNVAPSPKDNTKTQVIGFFELTEQTTIYFVARQRSGGDLAVSLPTYSIVEV